MAIWFIWWLVFVFVLLLLPLGYGYGYRRWGTPYPSWSARARERAAVEEVATWGLLADFVWIMALVALVWLVLALVL